MPVYRLGRDGEAALAMTEEALMSGMEGLRRASSGRPRVWEGSSGGDKKEKEKRANGTVRRE